jgi:hypothetical protein
MEVDVKKTALFLAVILLMSRALADNKKETERVENAGKVMRWGGAGYVGNIYTGQGTAGRGGFIYNTNTNAGIAAGKNNVYAGKDGTVYRYNRDGGSWSSNSGDGWQPIDRPAPKLQTQQHMRNKGDQRSQNFNSMRSFGGTRMRGGGRRR